MARYSSYLIECVFFIVSMWVANTAFDDIDINIRNLQARNIIACMQVFILTTIYVSYTICASIVNLIKRDTLLFTRLKNTQQHEKSSSKIAATNTQDNKSTHEFQETSLQNAKSEIDSQEITKMRDNDNAISECMSDSNKMNIHVPVESETTNAFDVEDCSTYDDIDLKSLDSSSSSSSFHIVFTKSVNLDYYILYVNFVGLNLWHTFVCFNFAFYNTHLVFIIGIFVGWAINLFVKACQKRSFLLEVISLKWCIVYVCLGSFILSLGCVNWHTRIIEADVNTEEYTQSHNMDFTDRETSLNNWLFLYLPSLLTGFFWTFVSVDMAFAQSSLHENEPCERRGILYDAWRALPTFSLFMMLNGLHSDVDTRRQVVMFVSSLSRWATFHLLIIEPFVKFLSTYILIIALERQRHTDFTLSLVVTLAFYIVKENMFNNLGIQALSAGIFIFTLHLVKLIQLRFE